MKRFLEMVFLVFCAVSLAGTAWGNETPTSLAGVTVVDAAKAKSLTEGGAHMIDVRVPGEYAEAHVKGAKSIPYKESSPKAANYDPSVDSFDLGKLPGDKNAAVIFACNGPECWKSYKAAAAAAKGGFKRVYWYRGGLPEWKSKGYPVE